MRRLWSTLALFVVLAGLGGYIYFVTWKTTDETPTQEKLFAGLDANTITEMKVKSESGDVTTLKKDGDTWKVVTPMAIQASADAMGIPNGLADTEIVRVVDEAPTDVKEYGLDPARIEIEFKSSDGKTSGRLLVGHKTTTGSNLYARRDDQKRVVLIGDYHDTAFNKTTFSLRDKSIVKFDRAAVDGVDVNAGGKVTEFTKTGTEWKMTKPIAVRTDSTAVDALVSQVETAIMKSVVTTAPTPADLKKYGFDKPGAVVTLHMGSARASVVLGGKMDEMSVYVRDAAKPDVYTIESTTVNDFTKTADDYRKHELFDFRAFSANHVELTHAGQTVVLERVKAATEGSADTWHRVSPNPGDPDRTKVESLLAGLADVRANSFVDRTTRTGLDTPVLTVLARFEDGKKEERVTFGKSGANAFASRPDDLGAAAIDTQKLDDALKALDEISK